MRSDRRNPIGVIVRAALLVGLGIGAYAGLEGVDRALLSMRASDAPAPGVIPTAEPPGSRDAERAGASWLEHAIERLEQRQSVAVDIVQSGWIAGDLVETHGRYVRAGTGARRRFSQWMQGSIAGQPARIRRVSDSRFLSTDLRWGDPSEAGDRIVKRVDLRRLRQEISSKDPAPEAGRALASRPSMDLRWGGVASLLVSLKQSFDFGPARQMRLRGEPVFAMVGRWNRTRFAELLGSEDEPIPPRAPHHVVLALSEESLFPLLVEYRSADDPMAAAGLADESLLRPSTRPMLKIDFLRPEFDRPIPEAEFAYTAPSDAPLRDETDRELRIAERNRDARLAATSGDGPR